jgi:hypothetical protein
MKLSAQLKGLDQWERFVKRAEPEMRSQCISAAQKSRQNVARRMYELAPVGPDAPHMRDFIEIRGTRVGIFDEEQAHVALYNEYRPNVQPFATPAVREEESRFVQDQVRACRSVERALSVL